MKTLTQIIGDRIIRAAAEQTDLNASCRMLQDAIGQTDGGVAGAFFSGRLRHPSMNNGEWMDSEQAWPLQTVLYRENWLREYLQDEEAHHNQPSEELKADPDEVSAWADLMRNSKVGDVLVATGWRLDYPLSGIEAGARLIVVNNQLQQADPSLRARIAPVDKNFMNHPDELREWHDEAQLTPPDHENNSDEGVDAADIDNEGNAWTKYPLWAIRDNKALPEAHRIACVFTHKVAHTLGYKDMAELVALNAESGGRCNSQRLLRRQCADGRGV